VNYLFIHQNFPAQFLHLIRHLVAEGTHGIVFISEPNDNAIAGVRKVAYRMPERPQSNAHRDAQEFEQAVLRAEIVARTAANLKQLGFTPDIIIGHHGWGELLNIRDVWPDAPLLGYYEFFYGLDGLDVGFDPEFPTDPGQYARIRAKNTVNLLALNNGGHGQTPTLFQHGTYPAWARPGITVLPEGVNLDKCRPDPAAAAREFVLGDIRVEPGEKLVTYVARDLEPYRGFHIFMRALPRLLRARPDLRVVLVGGDGVSYGARLANGSWRQYMLAQLGDAIDLARVHFAGRVDYEDYVRLLQRSDAHVYLTYPFVASWSMREALACGCAVVGSDTAPVREFIADRQTGLLAPFLEPDSLADRVLEVLEDTALSRRLRQAARGWAEANLDMGAYIAAYQALIDTAIGG